MHDKSSPSIGSIRLCYEMTAEVTGFEGSRVQCLLFLVFLCERCGDRDDDLQDLCCGDGD